MKCPPVAPEALDSSEAELGREESMDSEMEQEGSLYHILSMSMQDGRNSTSATTCAAIGLLKVWQGYA